MTGRFLSKLTSSVRNTENVHVTREMRALALLSEYEQAGLGWFWETDRQGRLTYMSDQIVRKLGVDVDDVLGRKLSDIVVAQSGEAGQGGRTLNFHFSSRTQFTDLAVRARSEGQEERWWAVSGRPVLNEYQQFQGFRGSGSDLTEMRRSQDEASRLAQYDSLTGLSNRFQMMQTLEHTVTGAANNQRPCALLILDLDRFKAVNDTMGHPAGDALLKIVGKRLEQEVGKKGRVGRLGGDEFKIVVPDISKRSALEQLAKSIIAHLSQPYWIEEQQVIIGVSIGIALSPDDGVDADSLIRNADLALYAAKAAGKGVHRYYEKSMHKDADRRRSMENDLRAALSEGQLHLAYQPVVSTVTNRVTGFEALLRWTHPARGIVSPEEFIPIAEDVGLIQQIGEWALRTACMEVMKWPNEVRVAVNVSPVQFANPALPAIVTSALANASMPPDRLELELTESVFLNDSVNTDRMFETLKQIGVRLALDDFGTGYSSLGYLKKAPFDKIKIDQSFVRGATIKGSRNAAIIGAIVTLAEALGMETTAEGVETHDELDLIRELGCSHIQGYIFDKPLTADEAMTRLGDDTVAKAEGFKSSRAGRQTMLRTVYLIHGDQRYEARIRNISATGALIEGMADVPAGTEFVVQFSDSYFCVAITRWSLGERIGLEFEQSVDLARVKGITGSKIRKTAVFPNVAV